MRVQQVGQTWRTSARDDGSAAVSWLDTLGVNSNLSERRSTAERSKGIQTTMRRHFLAAGAFGKPSPGQAPEQDSDGDDLTCCFVRPRKKCVKSAKSAVVTDGRSGDGSAYVRSGLHRPPVREMRAELSVACRWPRLSLPVGSGGPAIPASAAVTDWAALVVGYVAMAIARHSTRVILGSRTVPRMPV